MKPVQIRAASTNLRLQVGLQNPVYQDKKFQVQWL